MLRARKIVCNGLLLTGRRIGVVAWLHFAFAGSFLIWGIGLRYRLTLQFFFLLAFFCKVLLTLFELVVRLGQWRVPGLC